MQLGELEGTLVHSFVLDPGDCSVSWNLGKYLGNEGGWERSKLFHSYDANGGCASML